MDKIYENSIAPYKLTNHQSSSNPLWNGWMKEYWTLIYYCHFFVLANGIFIITFHKLISIFFFFELKNFEIQYALMNKNKSTNFRFSDWWNFSVSLKYPFLNAILFVRKSLRSRTNFQFSFWFLCENFASFLSLSHSSVKLFNEIIFFKNLIFFIIKQRSFEWNFNLDYYWKKKQFIIYF